MSTEVVKKSQNLVNVVCEWPHRAGTAASYIRFGWVIKIQVQEWKISFYGVKNELLLMLNQDDFHEVWG